MTVISLWVLLLSIAAMCAVASYDLPTWLYRLPLVTTAVSFITMVSGLSIWMWNVMP